MKPDFYMFEYSTKTCKRKRISYSACSWRSALRRFKKNVRCTKLLGKWKVSSDYPTWVVWTGKPQEAVAKTESL